MIVDEIQAQLFALQDQDYRNFHAKLMPTINKETIIGVRVPVLRKLAKELKTHPNIEEFLRVLPHTYYEENNLHALIIMSYKNPDKGVAALDEFLPFVDNWATCDMIKPASFTKDCKLAEQNALRWIEYEKPFTVRFGISVLMKFCLNGGFKYEHLEIVSSIQSEEYYVNMMRAWYFAEALVKQKEATMPFIEQQRMDVWTHNKAIQKACESYRISKELKEHLRTLKVK